MDVYANCLGRIPAAGSLGSESVNSPLPPHPIVTCGRLCCLDDHVQIGTMCVSGKAKDLILEVIADYQYPNWYTSTVR
jgi:hypothetical protein